MVFVHALIYGMVYQEFMPMSLCEAHVSTVCVGIVFKRRTRSMTVYSQLANDTDSNFKSHPYVEDRGLRNSVLILPNGPSKVGNGRMAEINFGYE